jgi:translation initiation factor IF-1
MARAEADATGIVREVLPKNLYRVELTTGLFNDKERKEVICYEAGKLRLHKIRIVIGDNVSIVLDKFGGKTTNRIVRRL